MATQTVDKPTIAPRELPDMATDPEALLIAGLLNGIPAAFRAVAAAGLTPSEFNEPIYGRLFEAVYGGGIPGERGLSREIFDRIDGVGLLGNRLEPVNATQPPQWRTEDIVLFASLGFGMPPEVFGPMVEAIQARSKGHIAVVEWWLMGYDRDPMED